MASELLNEVLEPESPSRRQVAMVKRAVDRMNRLIGDLLDAKRLEHGKLAVEPRPVPPQPILAEAVEMLRGVAAASKVDLVLDASTELPVVMADANRIQQVLSNLIGNGIKFTPPGGTITVRGEKAMGGVRIAVADTGSGIPVDQLGHIFGRFWQGSRTDKRGIGLGLAIAKGLVEAHEGKIWVESTVGTGTTFYFTLPIQ
jgi:signal transduction histidine kinase